MHVCLMSRNLFFVLKKVTSKNIDCSELPGSVEENQHDGSGMATFKKCNSKVYGG